MRRTATVAVLSLLLSGAANADTESLFVHGGVQALLATKQAFSIEVLDQAKDGCLPQPSRLKDRLEVSLRKNGFEITEKAVLGNHITISTLGYGTTPGTCAIAVRAILEFPILANVPFAQKMPDGSQTVASYFYDFNQFLLTGRKADMQSRLEKWATDSGDELFLDISRARDSIFKKFPAIKASFEGKD